MDFSNRPTQHTTAGGAPEATAATAAVHKRKASYKLSGKGWRAASVLLLLGVAIVLVALALLFITNGNSESNLVNKKLFQAVDISVGGSNNSDQLYFGKIKSINSQTLVLEDVYYIQNASSASSGISLQPLVCQIDAPYNRMVISRSSVNWWENLQTSGTVSQKIAQFEKSNPNGPTCSTSSSSSSTQSSSSSSSSGTSTTPPNTTSTTPSSSTTTKTTAPTNTNSTTTTTKK